MLRLKPYTQKPNSAWLYNTFKHICNNSIQRKKGYQFENGMVDMGAFVKKGLGRSPEGESGRKKVSQSYFTENV